MSPEWLRSETMVSQTCKHIRRTSQQQQGHEVREAQVGRTGGGSGRCTSAGHQYPPSAKARGRLCSSGCGRTVQHLRRRVSPASSRTWPGRSQLDGSRLRGGLGKGARPREPSPEGASVSPPRLTLAWPLPEASALAVSTPDALLLTPALAEEPCSPEALGASLGLAWTVALTCH